MGATIAVIGLGRIGAFHAETLSGLAGVDELVVTDERPEVTAAVADKLGARAVPDAQAALAAGVDGVVIAAATPAHARLILAAVEAGIPVFCEKPIAFTADESREVVARLADSTVPVQIGYNRRFDPAYVAAYDAVRAGELGRLTTVRSTTMDPAPPPAAYVAASGGIFRDCSVHDFDIVRWIVGREVVEVYATGTDHGEAMFAQAGDAATAQTLLTLTTARWGWCPTPATTGAAMTAGWNCTAAPTPWSPAGTPVCRCATSAPAKRSRTVPPTSSSWTASSRPTARN